MLSAENQLIAFRRVIWNVRDYHKILWKRQQSDIFEMNIGNLKINWNIILRHCDSSNWIMLILSQQSNVLSDKIILRGKIKIFCGSFSHSIQEQLCCKLTKKDLELKLINSKLMPFNEKNAKNKCLTLEIELSLSSNEAELCPQLTKSNDQHQQSRDLIKNDFTLTCSDELEVPVNKEILILHSPVFKAMFETDMVEQKINMAHLDDIDSNTMRQVIDFLHTGCVDFYKGDAKKLLYVAEKYDLLSLRNECHNALMSQIVSENVFEILETADIYQLKRLEAKCLIFIVKNYPTFSRSEHWKKLQELEIDLMTKVTDALSNFTLAIELKDKV